jgi:hypothetical protein
MASKVLVIVSTAEKQKALTGIIDEGYVPMVF